MTEQAQWKPQGETVQDRAIETSRKLIEIGMANAGVVERVVFQEIGRVLSPRLEQRIRDVSESEVRGQLLTLSSWISAILGEPEQQDASTFGERKNSTKTKKRASHPKPDIRLKAVAAKSPITGRRRSRQPQSQLPMQLTKTPGSHRLTRFGNQGPV